MSLQVNHIPTGVHVHTYKYVCVYVLSVLRKIACAVNKESLLHAGFA